MSREWLADDQSQLELEPPSLEPPLSPDEPPLSWLP
jgi:hypothetical protein